MLRNMAVPARLVRLTAAAALAIATMSGIACSNDKPTGPSSHGIAGTYTLRTVDGENVPVTIHDGPWFDASTTTFYDRITVNAVDGSIALSNDGTFTASFTYKMSANGLTNTSTLESSGQYVTQNDQMQLLSDNGAIEDVTIGDGQMVLDMDIMGIGTLDEYVLSK